MFIPDGRPSPFVAAERWSGPQLIKYLICLIAKGGCYVFTAEVDS